jgi:hypothetical protein
MLHLFFSPQRVNRTCVCKYHRLSINRPTKRGKEKSPSDGHCQCKEEMDNNLLVCQQILEREPHSDTPTKEEHHF